MMESEDKTIKISGYTLGETPSNPDSAQISLSPFTRRLPHCLLKHFT